MAEGRVHGERRAGERPGVGTVGEPGHAVADLDRRRAEPVIAVADPRRRHRVRDEQAPPRLRGEDRPQHRGVQVHAVGDELDVDRCLEQGTDRSGVAVVQGRHGVEEMGADAGARVDRGPHDVVRRVGVADRDDHAGVGETAYGVEAAGQLGGDRDHADGPLARGEQRVGARSVGRGEQVATVGTRPSGAQPRPLEVDPGEPAGPGEQGELPRRPARPVGRVRHQAGRHGRRPAGEVGRDHGLRGLGGAGVERRPAAAVHVEVDEAGHDRRRTQVEVRGARWCAVGDLDDALAGDEQPPRREDPRRGHHRSGREEHQSTAPLPTVRACGRPGSSRAGVVSPARSASSCAHTAVP